MMNYSNAVKEKRFISGRNVAEKQIKKFNPEKYQALQQLGIGLDAIVHFGMDALQPTVNPAGISVPVQFLQNWLPGLVNVVTAPRKADILAGILMSGSWEDEEVVQQTMELTGLAQPYGDYTQSPMASFQNGFERRTVVRFEQGMMVGNLEQARTAKVNIDLGAQKRSSAALSLEIVRNLTAFYGYNNGANRTYGFLNDPSEPAYVTVANGASGSPLWSTKTYLEICKDIRTAMASLRNQSQDNIDTDSTPITLAVATAVVDYLSSATDFNVSVMDWLKKSYPNVRVISAPELTAANGGANVFYLYAEKVVDESTDGGRVFDNLVQTKFQVQGVKQDIKGYKEAYLNAVAGMMCKRPWAMVRRSGI